MRVCVCVWGGACSLTCSENPAPFVQNYRQALVSGAVFQRAESLLYAMEHILQSGERDIFGEARRNVFHLSRGSPSPSMHPCHSTDLYTQDQCTVHCVTMQTTQRIQECVGKTHAHRVTTSPGGEV